MPEKFERLERSGRFMWAQISTGPGGPQIRCWSVYRLEQSPSSRTASHAAAGVCIEVVGWNAKLGGEVEVLMPSRWTKVTPTKRIPLSKQEESDKRAAHTEPEAKSEADS